MLKAKTQKEFIFRQIYFEMASNDQSQIIGIYQLLLQIATMGISMPNSLAQLAKYWDCLQNTERFKHQADPSEKTEKAQSEHQNQITPKKQQPRRAFPQNIQQNFIEEPPQVKIIKSTLPQAAMKRRSKLLIKDIPESKKTIEEISDIANEPSFNNQTDDLEIIQIEKDQDVKANNLKKLYNPLFKTTNNFKQQRDQRSVSLLQAKMGGNHKQFDDIEISEINEPPSHDYQQFFLNQIDQEEYNRKNM